jgi:hypothetical protein
MVIGTWQARRKKGLARRDFRTGQLKATAESDDKKRQ